MDLYWFPELTLSQSHVSAFLVKKWHKKVVVQNQSKQHLIVTIKQYDTSLKLQAEKKKQQPHKQMKNHSLGENVAVKIKLLFDQFNKNYWKY